MHVKHCYESEPKLIPYLDQTSIPTDLENSSAVYFDHRRRTDPNFRKQLKKESRKLARAAKEEAEAQNAQKRSQIRTKIAEAKAEGFPHDVEEKEAYFMQEVARGETLSQDGLLPRLDKSRSSSNSTQVTTTSKLRYPSTKHLKSTHNLRT